MTYFSGSTSAGRDVDELRHPLSNKTRGPFVVPVVDCESTEDKPLTKSPPCLQHAINAAYGANHQVLWYPRHLCGVNCQFNRKHQRHVLSDGMVI